MEIRNLSIYIYIYVSHKREIERAEKAISTRSVLGLVMKEPTLNKRCINRYLPSAWSRLRRYLYTLEI